MNQAGILAEETKLARYMTFALKKPGGVKNALASLASAVDTGQTVVGLGQSLVVALEKDVPGLKSFTAQRVSGIDVPAVAPALWLWLRGSDRGELFHRSRRIETLLSPAFSLDTVVDAFQYDENRDLSGYVDGTENPSGDEAVKAALIQGQGAGMDGGSFVAVMKWLHDFESFNAMTVEEQDDAIGRHVSNNEEFDEAPPSAHVKRAAQESYSPEAFMLRRSMPWAQGMQAGLVFVAFGHSFDAFEAVLKRMLGKEDDIQDALFRFTQPLSSAYFWCPPVKDGKLDLSMIGVSA